MPLFNIKILCFYLTTIHTSLLFLHFSGVPSNLMIEALHLNPPGILEKVEFLNLRGETIFETRLTQSTENPDLYIAPRTIPPDSYFHIRVSGIDSMNFRFQRLSKAAISPLIPGE